METVLLHELKGTRYFYESTASWLLNLPKDKIIDVKGCKFTTECANTLCSLQQQGYTIIDTENEGRSRIFALNTEIIDNIKKYDNKIVNLPDIRKYADLVQYINALDENKVYKRSYVGKDDLDIYLIILINMFRPEIKIDPMMLLPEIFKKMKLHMTKQVVDGYIREHKRLQYIYEYASVPILITPQMTHITLLSGEVMPVDKFRLKYILIPNEFGNEVCMGGVWERIFKECHDYLEWTQKKTQRTLYSLISKQVKPNK